MLAADRGIFCQVEKGWERREALKMESRCGSEVIFKPYWFVCLCVGDKLKRKSDDFFFIRKLSRIYSVQWLNQNFHPFKLMSFGTGDNFKY